ncbi:hypothetical protein C8Q74DRAFT_862165 [Fomes fomentarius]|nr:hypothetical protein C8Q74DRAFT_862165 [Fomes fomentarius]
MIVPCIPHSCATGPSHLSRHRHASDFSSRQEQVIKRWTKLVHGLRIRQRLLEQYADRAPGPGTEGRSGAGVKADNQSAVEDPSGEKLAAAPVAGGFLTGVDDVVQPYALPRNLHEIVEHASTSHTALGELKKNVDPYSRSHSNLNSTLSFKEAADAPEEEGEDERNAEAFQADRLDIVQAGHEGEDDDAMMEDVPLPVAEPLRLNGAPKTMQELAEAAARRSVSMHTPENTEEELALDLTSTAAAAPSSVDADGLEVGQDSGRRTRSSASRAGTTGKNAGAANVRTGGSATASGAGDTPTPRTRTRPSAKSRPAKATLQSRKRTRAQADGSDSDAAVDEDRPVSSPVKKTTRARAPPPAIVPSTRVLRTRKPKEAEKVQEEKELEDAYRRAVAE